MLRWFLWCLLRYSIEEVLHCSPETYFPNTRRNGKDLVYSRSIFVFISHHPPF